MRQAQDDEIRLKGQSQEQLRQFAIAKQWLKQAQHMLDVVASCKGRPDKDVAS